MEIPQIGINENGGLYIYTIKNIIDERKNIIDERKNILIKWSRNQYYDPEMKKKISPGCPRWKELYLEATKYNIKNIRYCTASWTMIDVTDINSSCRSLFKNCIKCRHIMTPFYFHIDNLNSTCIYCKKSAIIKYKCLTC